jgi:hypothetical protein
MKKILCALLFMSSLQGMQFVLDLDNPKLAEEIARMEIALDQLEKSIKEFKTIVDPKESDKKLTEIILHYDTMNDSFLWIPQLKEKSP